MTPSRRQTVLLIDDDPAIHRLVRARLSRLDAEVRCAADGPTGLREARREPPDLVLLDVAMDGMDGFDVFRKLQHESATADVPVIFLTGVEGREDRIRGLEMGAMDYVTKPFDAIELRARVGTALRTQALVEALEVQVWTDDLTGLPNRGAFRKAVQQCLERRRHDAGYSFAVLFLDLDGFKLVNDSLGHRIGDEVLIATAKKLNRCLRDARGESRDRGRDLVARLGGDEFAIVLDGVDDGQVASRVAGRIEAELAKPVIAGGYRANLGASIGIKLSEPETESTDHLLRDCDAAMYAAKKAGGGQHAVFDEQMHQEALRRLRLEHELREALDREQFTLHYQPLIGLEDGEPVGFEALIRWEHPEHGRIRPDDFIPVAEETGLIVEIERWTLREACRQLVRWDSRHPGAVPMVSINVSKVQLQAPDFLEQLTGALEETGVAPNRLQLEVTESAIMHNPEAVLPVLSAARQKGVWVALDDFGTGYSSLASVHRFPLDVLKIDKTFIQAMDQARVHAAILQTITCLAHNLGLSVVAEGIEANEQVALLQALDCDYAQGFYFSKPLPAAEIPEHLFRGRNWAKTA